MASCLHGTNANLALVAECSNHLRWDCLVEGRISTIGFYWLLPSFGAGLSTFSCQHGANNSLQIYTTYYINSRFTGNPDTKGKNLSVVFPVTQSWPCCDHTWQSKRPFSVQIVQSRICDNLLSSLFIRFTGIPTFIIKAKSDGQCLSYRTLLTKSMGILFWTQRPFLPQHRFLFEANFAALGNRQTSHHLLWLADMDSAVAAALPAQLGSLTPQATTFFAENSQPPHSYPTQGDRICLLTNAGQTTNQ